MLVDENRKVQQLEQELKELKNQLVQASKLAEIGLLASIIAHEMKQPLFGIKSYAQLLLEELDESSRSHRKVENILKQAQLLEKMVARIRDFSRVQEADAFTEVDVNVPVRDALELISHRAKKFSINLQQNLADSLPRVKGNANRIQQVVLNLLDNALDAIEETSGGTVGVRTFSTDGFVCILIYDTGPGIPEELKERIFEPFYTTKGQGKGTGLGLYICSEIVKEHGGEIKLLEEIPEELRQHGVKTAFLVKFPSTR